MKNCKYILICIIACSVFRLSAQTVVPYDSTIFTIEEEAASDYLPASLHIDSILLQIRRDSADSVTMRIMSEELDMMMLDYSADGECRPVNEQIEETDSLYISRLQNLPYIIEMPYNKIVRSYIDLYIRRRPQQIANMTALSQYYFPIFEQKLAQYNLPYELKYLPIIESALNVRAYSRAGAAGLWQFMPATGKLYGLEVNSLVDERMDPYKATDAACRYLRDLYAIHGDWHIVIAAYNCGSGNIRKARARSGKQDYWSIYPYLPAETRGYVPIFIAANYAMNYANEHQICNSDIVMPTASDTIQTDRRLHLLQVAEVLSIPIDDLRKLNPQYRRDILPGGKKYSLALPENKLDSFLLREQEIYDYKADSLINNRRTEIETARKSSAIPGNGNYVVYTVRQGDTLGGIANRYHVSIKQLQQWNGIKGSTIYIGKKLKIYGR